jgi:hypothetical protein
MKKKLIEFALWIISFLLLVTHCIYNDYGNSLIEDYFSGIVIRKFIDTDNRHKPTLEILIIEEGIESKYYIGANGWCNDIYQDAQIGDSIYKYNNNPEFILKRDTITCIYEYSRSCYGFKKIR